MLDHLKMTFYQPKMNKTHQTHSASSPSGNHRCGYLDLVSWVGSVAFGSIVIRSVVIQSRSIVIVSVLVVVGSAYVAIGFASVVVGSGSIVMGSVVIQSRSIVIVSVVVGSTYVHLCRQKGRMAQMTKSGGRRTHDQLIILLWISICYMEATNGRFYFSKQQIIENQQCISNVAQST